jgi:hypothetical protein
MVEASDEEGHARQDEVNGPEHDDHWHHCADGDNDHDGRTDDCRAACLPPRTYSGPRLRPCTDSWSRLRPRAGSRSRLRPRPDVRAGTASCPRADCGI